LKISETHEMPFEEIVALGAIARARRGGVSVIGVLSALQLFLSGCVSTWSGRGSGSFLRKHSPAPFTQALELQSFALEKPCG
jgi:hypothetical protein